MTHRGYIRHGEDAESLARFSTPSRVAGDTDHHGQCPCGTETTRNVTIGPSGHPRNGWECAACGERFLRAEYESRSVGLPVKGEA